jgi:hypothetical protein
MIFSTLINPSDWINGKEFFKKYYLFFNYCANKAQLFIILKYTYTRMT